MQLFPKWKEQKLWQKFANVFALIFLAACLLIIIFFYNDDSWFGPTYKLLIYIISLGPLWRVFYLNLITSELIPESISLYILHDLTIIIVPIIGLITYYLIGALLGALIGLIIGKFKKTQTAIKKKEKNLS